MPPIPTRMPTYDAEDVARMRLRAARAKEPPKRTWWDTASDYGGALKEGAVGAVTGLEHMIKTATGDPMTSVANGQDLYDAYQRFKGGSALDRTKQVGVGGVEQVTGLPISQVYDDYQRGDYAKAAGHATIPIALALLMHRAATKGGVPEGAPPAPPQRALPAFGETTTPSQPRFFGGRRGLVDAEQPGILDVSPVRPDFSETATVLPREMEGLHHVDPIVQANYSGTGEPMGLPDLGSDIVGTRADKPQVRFRGGTREQPLYNDRFSGTDPNVPNVQPVDTATETELPKYPIGRKTRFVPNSVKNQPELDFATRMRLRNDGVLNDVESVGASSTPRAQAARSGEGPLTENFPGNKAIPGTIKDSTIQTQQSGRPYAKLTASDLKTLAERGDKTAIKEQNLRDKVANRGRLSLKQRLTDETGSIGPGTEQLMQERAAHVDPVEATAEQEHNVSEGRYAQPGEVHDNPYYVGGSRLHNTLDLAQKLGHDDPNSFSTLANHFSGSGRVEPVGRVKRLFNDQSGEVNLDPARIVEGAKNLIKRTGATRETAIDAAGVPRSLQASLDVSAPFRQGVFLVGRKQFWTSLKPMFQALTSEKNFEGINQAIKASPRYLESRKAGLALNEMKDLSGREEQFMSNMAEHWGYRPEKGQEGIPGVSKPLSKTVGRAVRVSGRAYTGFLNKLRSDVYTDIMNKADAMGNTNPKLAQQVARYVNTASGRGNLGALEHSAKGLNMLLFSPRLIASRLKLLNPYTYLDPRTDPFVRRQALGDLLKFAGAGVSIVGLAKASGAEVETNPTSSDFGKINIHGTRFDVFGGFQPYVRLAAQLATGKYTSPITKKTQELGHTAVTPTRKDLVYRFGESKLAPIPSFMVDALQDRDFTGQPFNLPTAVRTRVTPLMIQDIVQVAKDNPELLPVAIPAAASGVGVQTFGEESGHRRRKTRSVKRAKR
jgi:hypothetical protein